MKRHDHRVTGPCLLLLVALASVQAQDLSDLDWREPLSDANRWTRQPAWLRNPSPTAAARANGEGVCFMVNEPAQGMKWSATTQSIPLDELPYLSILYRAENVTTNGNDYLVYLNDGVPSRQLNAFRLCDVVPDGRRHSLAIDVSTLTLARSIQDMAVQVQSDQQGTARLWLDRLAFTAVPPQGARVIRRAPAVAQEPDWTVPLNKAIWKSEPAWLDNPADAGQYNATRDKRINRFHASQPGTGMKWSCYTGEQVSLHGHRYVSLRYRATALTSRGEYAVCALGHPVDGGPSYATLVETSDLMTDGRWHTTCVDLRKAASRLPQLHGFAIQVQAGAPGAVLDVSDISLVNTRPTSALDDAIDCEPGARFNECAHVSIVSAATAESAEWRQHLLLADWFKQPDNTVHGIPFRLANRSLDLAATPLREKGQLALTVDLSCSEIYLLLLAVMSGDDEPPYSSGKLGKIRDVDRFRLQLEYADGIVDECLPMNVATKQFGISKGVQAVAAAADPLRRLQRVVVLDLCRQAAFAVAAATARVTGPRMFPGTLEVSTPLRRTPAGAPPSLKAILSPADPRFALRVDGREIPIIDFEPLPDQRPGMTMYQVRTVDGLRVGLSVRAIGDAAVKVHAQVWNNGQVERQIDIKAPVVGPYRLSHVDEETYYLVPKCGAALDNRPCSYRERYSGTFPVQFLDTFAPARGRGLTLRTTDTACLRKHYLLEKKNGQLTLGVAYSDICLQADQAFVTAETILTATDGGMTRGLTAYRQWVDNWHQPISARKPWFQEIFNFRQRFLWHLDPLYDQHSGVLDLGRALEEARLEFGGIDYLHLFDWGTCPGIGRMYGRTGDHSPYDHLQGGREALRKAISGVQAMGVPTGLYIEGYLLEERGRLGQAHGRQWQVVNRAGDRAYWPDSTEMSICPGVEAWQDVQASTYAAKVGELDADGMYIDQFGFANPGKDCWSDAHGHAVPSYPVTSERKCTQRIRRSIEQVKTNVAIYTEEMPVDVTTQDQDGSFTYAMLSANHTQTRVPLNAARFAIPGFKTIEILYCDKPTGSWATGVKWVFFNGEAIWLEGPAKIWFEPETRRTIRRCYAILREHRDAFTGPNPDPLVPTEMGGVFANAFYAGNKTVYTFYNANNRTVRGPVLRNPHRDGATYYDAWHAGPGVVRLEGHEAIVSLDIGPHGVGCLVVRHGDGR